MGRLDRRVDAVAEAHPLLYAVAVGLAGGVLALLVGWLARRDWIWLLFIVTTVGAGATAYSGPAGDNSTRASPGVFSILPCAVWFEGGQPCELQVGGLLTVGSAPRTLTFWVRHRNVCGGAS